MFYYESQIYCISPKCSFYESPDHYCIKFFWMLNKNLIFWMNICFVVADEDIPINLNLFLQGDVEDPDPSGSKPFWPDPDSVTKLNHNKVFNSWYQKSFINIVIKGQTLILKYVIGRITDYTLYVYSTKLDPDPVRKVQIRITGSDTAFPHNL